MKIAHVISYFQPPLGYQEYYLAKEQQEMGHEVHVLTSDRYYPLRGVWPALGNRVVGHGDFNEAGLSVHRLRCVFEGITYCVVGGLKKKLESIRPEVVHAHEIQTITPSLPALYKEKIGYSYIIDTHTFMHPSQLADRIIYSALRPCIFSYAVSKADAVIAIADNCRKWFLNEFSCLSPRRVSVIPLGAEHQTFRPDSKARLEARLDLMISQDEKLLIYAGKILPSKDIHILLQAIRILVRKGAKIKGLLIGSGDKRYTDTLVEMTNHLGLKDHVTFHPPVPNNELPRLLNAADVGVWPGSRSISIIEAMATGLPIVIPENVPSDVYAYAHSAKYLLTYNNGLSFTRGNVKELALCIEHLLSDEATRQSMGRRSRKLVEDRMNWKSLVLDFAEIYKRCAHDSW